MVYDYFVKMGSLRTQNNLLTIFITMIKEREFIFTYR